MAKAKDKERTLKTARENQELIVREPKTCCSPEESDEIVKVVKGENLACSTQEDYHLE